MTITIIGLGPGDGRHITRETWARLEAARTLYVRTRRHPAVADLPTHLAIHDFDALYERAERFEDVYQGIVDALLAQARTEDLLYAVPGHPTVGEATVAGLADAAREAGVALEILPGLSFIEPALTAVGHDALSGLQLFDALDLIQRHHPPLDPDVPLLLGQLYNRTVAADVKLALMRVYPDDHLVQRVRAATTAEVRVIAGPLYAVDRDDDVDHLTSLYVPPRAQPAGLATLADTVATLRAPGGCPWDQEQTPQSMRAGLQEEAAEVLDALDGGDDDALREELGDLLYHIVMQTEMATEAEAFTLADVIAGIDAKLKRRHPHVWGDVTVNDSAEVVANWERLKTREKEIADDTARANETGGVPASLLDRVPVALPALARAQALQARAARVGFDWPDIDGVEAKIAEEMAEVKAAATPAETAAEVGDLLFVLVNWSRWLDVDAEMALREANRRFGQRFRLMEQMAYARRRDLADLDGDALEALWQQAKEHAKSDAGRDKEG